MHRNDIVHRRRRVGVFAGVFALVAAVGLWWDYSRPAQYRTVGRVELRIPTAADAQGDTGNGRDPAFLAEVERMASRPMLERAIERARSQSPDFLAGELDPPFTLQRMLTVTPVEGTRLVQIWATGPIAEVLPVAIDRLVDAYRDELMERGKSDSGEAAAQARQEVARLEASVAERRRAVENFRARHQIVSLEREENEVLARLRGQTTALNTAEEKVSAAEGQLRSLKEAVAAGKAPVRARDNPTLANLEQRASQIREQLRDLGRSYTEDYLVRDPNVVGMRTRLAELESQIARERAQSQVAAVEEAEQALAGARITAERIREQIGADKGKVQAFAARMSEYKLLTEQLAGLETVYRSASERALKLATTGIVRVPSLRVVEAAAVPKSPWQPAYERDAAIVLGVALVAALIGLLIFDYLVPRERTPAVLVAQGPMWMGQGGSPLQLANGANAGVGQLASPRAAARLAGGHDLLAQEAARQAEPSLLGDGGVLPPTLEAEQVRALLAAADPPARVAIGLLLSGLKPDEALALTWGAVDAQAGVLAVPGTDRRELPLREPLAGMLAAVRSSAPESQETVLPYGPAAAEGRDALDSAIACAAHDAQIADAARIDAETVRHTCIAYLVGQGLRFSELPRIVGSLPSARLAAYMALAPRGERRSLDAIEPDMLSTLSPATATG